MPRGWYVQECLFVGNHGTADEAARFLLTYGEESQLKIYGSVPDDATSEQCGF